MNSARIQISLGLRRQISSPFNRYEDRADNAHVEVAFAWQSAHGPLQQSTSYGVDAAFPDSFQPAFCLESTDGLPESGHVS